MPSNPRLPIAAFLLALPFVQSTVLAHQVPAPAAKPGELTVDRIYGQPSLSGRLTRGIAWLGIGQWALFASTAVMMLPVALFYHPRETPRPEEDVLQA